MTNVYTRIKGELYDRLYDTANGVSSEVGLAVWREVNDQPRSEPPFVMMRNLPRELVKRGLCEAVLAWRGG